MKVGHYGRFRKQANRQYLRPGAGGASFKPTSDHGLNPQRILIMDGAMGTIQRYKLVELDYRGARFAEHPIDLKNNGEVLSLVRPDIIEEIHGAYLDAGADIIETSTFNATVISMADFDMVSLVYELNVEGAKIALSRRRRCDAPRSVAPALCRRCACWS